METQTNVTQASKSPHPLVWVAGVALIVFCGAGVSAIMGWIPTSIGTPAEPATPLSSKPQAAPSKVVVVHTPAKVAAVAAPVAVAAAKCAECGVVQSVH